MKITLSNIICINEPTDKIKKYCETKLTFKNPEYEKKRQMGLWLAQTPRYIRLYDYDKDNIYIPIGCFTDIYEMYPDNSLYCDYSVKVKRNFSSSIILRDYQEPCLNALKTHVNGLFILPCGLSEKQNVHYKQHIFCNNILCLLHTQKT